MSSSKHRHLRMIVAIVVGMSLPIVSQLHAQSPKLIAETAPLTPTEQQKIFHLPPGFEIQLVAAEPTIGQPMNLNFDAASRLWVTHSIEYPFPARGDVEPRDARFPDISDHDPRDRLTVLSGIGPDGTPAKTSTFINGLNIPIGQVPVKGGALVYTIPNIYFCPDADGDGKADSQQKLYGKFGNIDTHGMNNGFTRWIDGWIYACHGFRNTSTVKGSDGHVVAMNSGNTYRFREDGSRIEQFTWGQVNPFGLTFDPLGNVYSADCHSMPLTLLLRGAYYSSFGKPHDGLGYGPDMIAHSHGSTGICGPAYYAATHFPAEYRDNVFLCNPVTGRVHRDRLKDVGSTRLVETQPDFITCDDPWFRPVDLKFGTDGALYIADFYNSIIGHYEVPLKHPNRDRERGRIWRVVYRGGNRPQKVPSALDLTRLDLPQLLEQLGADNLVVRTLATNEILDRFGARAVLPVRRLLVGESTAAQRAHALWILFRSEALDITTAKTLSRDESRLVRTHLARALAEQPKWQPAHFEIARRLLTDKDAFVRRAAADALGQQPHIENVEPVLSLLAATASGDTHLRHTIKIALRNQLRDDSVLTQLDRLNLDASSRRQLATIALSVPTQPAADWLTKQLSALDFEGTQVRRFVEFIARHGASAALETLAKQLRKSLAANPAAQHQQLLAIHAGLQQRGMTNSPVIRNWALELARQLLQAKSTATISWTDSPIPGIAGRQDSWVVQQRVCADGKQAAFFSTLPRGENATGVYRSETFPLPADLSFYVAGHCGIPSQPCHKKNLVRLRDAKTGATLAEAFAPRNDTAQKVVWKLPVHAGKRVYLELIDGDAYARGYAWLAVGRFSLDALNPKQFSTYAAAASLVDLFKLHELKPDLVRLLAENDSHPTLRAAAAKALLALKPDARLSALIPVTTLPTTTAALRSEIYDSIRQRNDQQTAKVLASAMNNLSNPQQTALAQTLVTDAAGGEALLKLVDDGKASARLLTLPPIRQRLDAFKLPDADNRIAALTARLPKPGESITKLISTQRQAFVASKALPMQGFEIYKKICAACHRIGKEGALIGPQLDGIGIRPLDRILEDILDPNRNVDAAFRSTTIVQANGKVRIGLFRREQGETLIFADDKGKEFAIAKSDIEERSKSPLSPMPGNFGEKLKPEELNHLLAYLLSQRTKPEPVTRPGQNN